MLPPFDSLLKWELQNVARRFLPRGHRLAKCHRIRRADSNIEVRMSEERGKAFYAGVQTCGLVWLCPVCAPKIQAYRAAELALAIEQASRLGLIVELVTFTAPHSRSDRLADLEEKAGKAFRSMTDGRPYRRLAAELGIVGSVSSGEVTWGELNGWHPHRHMLRFRKPGPAGGSRHKLADHDREIFELWRGAVERHGLGKADVRGFSVEDGSKAHEYVQKMATEAVRFRWGTEDEMARSHTKRGRFGNLTPFDFLRMGAAGVEGPWQRLWREYAEAYKGKTQLRWSKGLRSRLGVTETATDEQLAESLGETWSWARHLTDDDWRVVRASNARGKLLQAAELAGREGVEIFLAELWRQNTKCEAGPWDDFNEWLRKQPAPKPKTVLTGEEWEAARLRFEEKQKRRTTSPPSVYDTRHYHTERP